MGIIVCIPSFQEKKQSTCGPIVQRDHCGRRERNGCSSMEEGFVSVSIVLGSRYFAKEAGVPVATDQFQCIVIIHNFAF